MAEEERWRFSSLRGVRWRVDLGILPASPEASVEELCHAAADSRRRCVICCMAYKNRDRLTKLPCEHQYHQTCVTKWLKINKVCPVCNKEVFGS